MIRRVGGWYAALTALLLLDPRVSAAAEDLSTAARELARRSATFFGSRALPNVTYRNRSSLPDSELDRARREFDAALPPGAAREASSPEARVTLSENAGHYLLIEEARRDEEAQTWIVAWGRTPLTRPPVPAMALERKLIWEQEEPILDLAIWDAGMLILSPSRLALYGRQGNQWTLRASAAINPSHAWPRDLRGRLRKMESRIEVSLPGLACQGEAGEKLTLACRSSADAWLLESGAHDLLLANFAPDRNYFDGNIVLQDGTRRMLPPFYSAAAAQDAGGREWLFTLPNGQTQIFDAGWQPVSAIASWGSDIVGIGGACGEHILATLPVDGSQPDALEAFSLANRAAVRTSAPLQFVGAITAMWPAGEGAALAVMRDAAGRRYSAYVVTLACGSAS
jgi:hypothetical protein